MQAEKTKRHEGKVIVMYTDQKMSALKLPNRRGAPSTEIISPPCTIEAAGSSLVTVVESIKLNFNDTSSVKLGLICLISLISSPDLSKCK